MDKETKYYLLQEIPKGEWCLSQVTEKDPRWQVIVPVLTKMYWLMNQELADKALSLNYSLDQGEWKDSQPLTELAKEFPGISQTQWYQYQLAEVMNPTRHTWMRLITTSKKPPLSV